MYSLYFDGASKTNPGPSGYGGVIYDEEMRILYKYSGACPGDSTNNFAEYYALIKGLDFALRNNVEDLKVYGDSKLVVEQFNGNWKLKSENLKSIYEQSQKLKKRFKTIQCYHIPRNQNKEADFLANKIFKK